MGGFAPPHDSATKRLSPAFSNVRALAWPPSRGGRGGVVVPPDVPPPARRPAVLEHWLTVHDRLDLPRHTADRAQQHVLSLVVGRRPPVGGGTVDIVVPRPD